MKWIKDFIKQDYQVRQKATEQRFRNESIDSRSFHFEYFVFCK